MDSALLKVDKEKARHVKHVKLRELNTTMDVRVHQRDSWGHTVEGIARCKTEKDVWSAVEVISALHRCFPAAFTPPLTISSLSTALVAPSRAALSALPPEQREKEDSARVSRQHPLLRLSNDPTLSSLPLLSIFLKSYSRPYLGLMPPQSKQISAEAEPGTLSSATTNATQGEFPMLLHEDEELVEQEIRDRFKHMCEGYFDSVSKKLTIEHKRLQDQDRRNHEAYIRSGEIFEDRQQAYEKMTKGYEKLLASCQTLSELLYLPMPSLPTVSQKSDSIQIRANAILGDDEDPLANSGGKWEDEEERRFFEDIQDLKDHAKVSFGH
ncbi:hypothetical protein EV702DRAFT_1197573 [Suillus placidus]|uniref:Uncharacterized protein n=1 Tax=Suillus placidus TaxID=48579 RepID=A0A9P6ZVY0_9AGAM|nr:hypothetical protein EV702DRAFT_1197573 [Suillus placidus]